MNAPKLALLMVPFAIAYALVVGPIADLTNVHPVRACRGAAFGNPGVVVCSTVSAEHALIGMVTHLPRKLFGG